MAYDTCTHTLSCSDCKLSLDIAEKEATLTIEDVHSSAHGRLVGSAPFGGAEVRRVDAYFVLEDDGSTPEAGSSVSSAAFDYDPDETDNKLACCRVRTTTSMLEIWMDQDNGVKYCRTLA